MATIKSKGYHMSDIPLGTYGEISKVEEEVAEYKDAIDQGNRIMALQELSDIIGAVKGVLLKNYPGYSLEDLMIMAAATERAFKSGQRASKFELKVHKIFDGNSGGALNGYVPEAGC